MTPDHPTPIALRTHSRDAVPFVLWGEGIAADGLQ
jgi:2,3-bisphosphoglycerate-independent phosphoglycerate mutase